MHSAVTIEVTFLPRPAGPAEGVVRMPDETLRPFCGWIDLLAALEEAAAGVRPNT